MKNIAEVLEGVKTVGIGGHILSLIHISEPTRQEESRIPASA